MDPIALPRRGVEEDAELPSLVANTASVHRRHRAVIYRHLAGDVGPGADAHMLHLLLRWAATHGLFIHPALRLSRKATPLRDHTFTLSRAVATHTPLFAVPERLCIGFKDVDDEAHLEELRKWAVKSEGAETADEDTDMCAFFFTAIGLLVNDILVALNNDQTDPRAVLALSLHQTRTLHNAPYLKDTAFGPETQLADVFLQMVHNYVQSGPLTGKVEREQLLWAVSLALSHSTPLCLGEKRSVGIVPFVHLVPHGGPSVNAVCVSRCDGLRWERLREYFVRLCPFADLPAEPCVFVVAREAIPAGAELAMQVMAPVCSCEEEAVQMWTLTSGAAPPGDALSSRDAAAIQAAFLEELRAVV